MGFWVRPAWPGSAVDAGESGDIPWSPQTMEEWLQSGGGQLQYQVSLTTALDLARSWPDLIAGVDICPTELVPPVIQQVLRLVDKTKN